jgi:hypothetical protein
VGEKGIEAQGGDILAKTAVEKRRVAELDQTSGEMLNGYSAGSPSAAGRFWK